LFKNGVRHYANQTAAVVCSNRGTGDLEDDSLTIELLLGGIVVVEQADDGKFSVFDRSE
jgi:hypothetical protein